MAEEKRQIRLVHQREGEGPLFIADIDQGVPREHLDEERGQEVYIPHDRLTFVMDGTAASVDRNLDIPGFIDLVPSDKVMLSKEQGTIARLEEDGLLDVVELPEGGVQDPVIDAGGATQDEGENLIIAGSNFESFSPDETQVEIDGELVDGGDVTVTDTEITVEGTGDLVADEEVVVIANRRRSNTEEVVFTAE